MENIKTKLYSVCKQYVDDRMEAAQLAIAQAQDAAQNDTKSSAGDKYETSREMAQQETDRNMAQLSEANKLRVALGRIDPSLIHDKADTGSLVITDQGTFFIAIGAGVLRIEDKEYFTVSPASPAGLALKGKKIGEAFVVNGKQYRITGIL